MNKPDREQELLWDIIEEFKLPKPIPPKEAKGKPIKDIRTGWINKGYAIIFEDNTCIYIESRDDDYSMIYGNINKTSDNVKGRNWEKKHGLSDYLVTIAYDESSPYHAAYVEFHNRLRKLADTIKTEQEMNDLDRLAKKYPFEASVLRTKYSKRKVK